MSFLDELSKYEVNEDESLEEAPTGFEMEPSEDGFGYTVLKGTVPCCKVEFINDRNDDSVDIDTAQEKPNQYTVYVMDIQDERFAKEFVSHLEDMGFDKVSAQEKLEVEYETNETPSEEKK